MNNKTYFIFEKMVLNIGIFTPKMSLPPRKSRVLAPLPDESVRFFLNILKF